MPNKPLQWASGAWVEVIRNTRDRRSQLPPSGLRSHPALRERSDSDLRIEPVESGRRAAGR